LITDVFSLSRVTAEELRWAERPRERFSCVRAASIGPKELAQLGEGLDVGSFEAVLSGFRFLAGESQEPPWVVSIPDVLVDRLHDLGDQDVISICAEWNEALTADAAHSRESLTAYLDRLIGFVNGREGPYALYVSSNEPHQRG
jgi:hypothetical protein